MNYLERVPEPAQSATSAATGTKELAADDRGHIFIAGTGRSGTSFLVRYLTELGLDTHLSRRGKGASWHEEASAGLEDLALPSSFADLPYVVKSPWLYQHVDELVASNAVRIEVVIIPVRNLVDAATSRSLVELQALHQTAPWMTRLKASWEHWGHTPGGAVFSLNPLDQARLLALGFHILIETLVRAEIPILFLEFPRLAEDGPYLFRKLRPWLPPNISEEQGLAAHRRGADPSRIRVRREPRLEAMQVCNQRAGQSPVLAYDDHAVLDQLAIRRELQRLRATLDSVHASWTWKVTHPLRWFTEALRAFVRTRTLPSAGPEPR